MTAPTLADRLAGVLVEPEDGAIVHVTTRGGWQNLDNERVFIRTDGRPGQNHGTWWPVGAAAGTPWTWVGINAWDEPVCDRPSVTVERLFTADEFAAGAR